LEMTHGRSYVTEIVAMYINKVWFRHR
jgi:hypothetical protein